MRREIHELSRDEVRVPEDFFPTLAIRVFLFTFICI